MTPWLRAIGTMAADQALQNLRVTLLQFVLMAVAALLVGVGLSFLTAALFEVISAAHGVLFAQLLLAALFLLMAMIFATVANFVGRRRAEPLAVAVAEDCRVGTEAVALPALVAAFATGFVGALVRRWRR